MHVVIVVHPAPLRAIAAATVGGLLLAQAEGQWLAEGGGLVVPGGQQLPRGAGGRVLGGGGDALRPALPGAGSEEGLGVGADGRAELLGIVRHGLGHHHEAVQAVPLVVGLVDGQHVQGPAALAQLVAGLAQDLVGVLQPLELALHLVVEDELGEAGGVGRGALRKVQVVPEGQLQPVRGGAHPVGVPLHVAVAPPVRGDQRHQAADGPVQRSLQPEQALERRVGAQEQPLVLRRGAGQRGLLGGGGGRGHGAPRAASAGEGQPVDAVHRVGGALGFRRLVQRHVIHPVPLFRAGLLAARCGRVQTLDAPGDVVGIAVLGAHGWGRLRQGRAPVSPRAQLGSSGGVAVVLRVQVLPQGLGARRGDVIDALRPARLSQRRREVVLFLPEPGLVSVAGGWSGVSLGNKWTRTLLCAERV